MTAFETNLWNFLSQKTHHDFNLLERLNLAINLAVEVQKMSRDYGRTTANKDLKPNNVVLDASGNLSIIDFGIEGTYGSYELTEISKGESFGTIAFVAPEKLTCKQQNYKVNVWALGKIIALINFEWSVGWQLLWSPKFLKPDERTSLGPLQQLIDLLKDMINVSYRHKYRGCVQLEHAQ